MEAHVERLFALGPTVTADAIAPLALPTVEIDAWDGASPILYTSTSGGGTWLITRTLVESPAALLGADYIAVTIDAWNSFDQNATLARIRIERHRDGACETEWLDRRYHDLARAGLLGGVTLDWLRDVLRKIGRPARSSGPSKSELKRAQTARSIVEHLVERSTITFANGSTAKDVLERVERVLFRLSGSRDEAIDNLLRMLRDTRHVTDVSATRDDVASALKSGGYTARRR